MQASAKFLRNPKHVSDVLIYFRLSDQPGLRLRSENL